MTDTTHEPTPVRLVRLLVNDVGTGDARVFTDTDITNFLNLEGGNVKLAAAQLLDTIASNEALLSKAIRTQDLTTDGSKTAAALRAHAGELRRQVAAADADMDAGFFDIIDEPTGSVPERTPHFHAGLF